MKFVEVSGDPQAVGQATGEALRGEIRENLELRAAAPNRAEWQKRLPALMDALKSYLPDVLEEIEGTAQGARLPVDDLLRLNVPLCPNGLDLGEGCTNVAFSAGPDGPVWGKNNDGLPGQDPLRVCARLVRLDGRVPLLTFTFCGMVATADGMNAEGLAVGHSSVGSIFQQSDHHVPIRLWAYSGMTSLRTTADFVRHMAELPTRGKGYALLCADREGALCSIEAPCPVMQVRRPGRGAAHMNCVNCYQLKDLARADRRTPEEKRNAWARAHFLDRHLWQRNALSLTAMKEVLRHHGDPSICRHGRLDEAVTTYSMIALPQSGRVLFLEGLPCRGEYSEIRL